MRVLLVEDDESLGFVVKDNLEFHGFVVDLQKDGLAAKESFQNNTYDICVLDVMLPKMDGFIKLNMGSAIGTGEQWVPWIHHEDLSRIFAHVIKNRLSGPFNAIADEQVKNASFMKTIAKVLRKKVFFPKVPAGVIVTLYGRMGRATILKGVRASNAKIKSTGFEFKFTELEDALREIYGKPKL